MLKVAASIRIPHIWRLYGRRCCHSTIHIPNVNFLFPMYKMTCRNITGNDGVDFSFGLPLWFCALIEF
ncbi:hypothetical protein J6590_052722 [Homalodisca vitripennis]|nr:hypothetical protein J6590_052722 [Homalodisca vitripennis]